MVYIDSPTVISKFPLEALYNCPRFTLTLGGRPADGLKSNFLKVSFFLNSTKSLQFSRYFQTLMEYGKVQECVIYAQREIMKYFNEPEAMVPNFPLIRRYPIPGISEFYELECRGKFGEQFVRLQRKQ